MDTLYKGGTSVKYQDFVSPNSTDIINKRLTAMPIILKQKVPETPYHLSNEFNSTMYLGIVTTDQHVHIDLIGDHLIKVIVISLVVLSVLVLLMYCCI